MAVGCIALQAVHALLLGFAHANELQALQRLSRQSRLCEEMWDNPATRAAVGLRDQLVLALVALAQQPLPLTDWSLGAAVKVTQQIVTIIIIIILIVIVVIIIVIISIIISIIVIIIVVIIVIIITFKVTRG